ncbi:hypothetical protein [Arsenophonus nasoniae]|uniref:Uncharacterized protein n=1 Tax=Arsenophonus nasoniae TaxID=638 RepID=A0AA95GQR2_9GAMM|nr:hypothetical protein [Arsenophonus nasoniae]WGM01004.1 hypothetical protein QE210_14310 [Arsenophonus nasoniae]
MIRTGGHLVFRQHPRVAVISGRVIKENSGDARAWAVSGINVIEENAYDR